MSPVKELYAVLKTKLLAFSKKVRSFICLKNFTRMTMNQLSLDPVNLLDISSPQVVEVKLNDIVYLKPNPKKETGDYYPAIGSIYEIDCKVSGISQDGTVIYLITGRGVSTKASKNDIVLPKNKYMYSTTAVMTSLCDTELFKKDTIFTLVGDYFTSEEAGVYIHVNKVKEFKHIFSDI